MFQSTNSMNRIFESQKYSEPLPIAQMLSKVAISELSDAALLTCLISNQATNEHQGKELLMKRQGMLSLSECGYRELIRIFKLSPLQAARLAAAFELSRRLAVCPIEKELKINEPSVIYNHFEPQLAHLKKEVFMVLLLNSANHLIHAHRISEGILNSALVHPREVFREAILEAAASIILLHNHPSGEVKPSLEDESITKRLVEVGRLMNIPVLDHIIIGRKCYLSFREEGLLQ